MQLGPDFRPAIAHRLAQDFDRGGGCRDGVIDEIDRSDAMPVAEMLELAQMRHMIETVAATAERRVPVELFLGIDRQQKTRTEARREARHGRRRRKIGDGSHRTRPAFGWPVQAGIAPVGSAPVRVSSG